MTYLILAEKPSQAANFAKFLGGRSGSFEGKNYIITNSVGHVIEHKKPDEGGVEAGLESQFNNWSDVESYPWDTSQLTWEYQAKAGKSDVINNVKELSKRPEVEAIILATDNDPDSGEGELLGWELINWIGWKGRVLRLDHEETEKTVKNGLRNLRDISDQSRDGDYLKALSRDKWDYISMQLSPVATILARQRGHNIVVRQGRLKSVMMNLVGQREDEIAKYVKKPYYEIQYRDEFQNVYKAKLPKIDEPNAFDSDLHFLDRSEAEAALVNFDDSKVHIDGEEIKHTTPPKLLDLLGISSALSSQGVKPKEVLETYQKMYEDQVVSYPRTEDNLINKEQFFELIPRLERIAAVIGADGSLLTHREPRESHVGSNVTHGANRPGENVPDSLNDLEKYGQNATIIYELLARNTLAMFCEDYEYLSTTASVHDNQFFTVCNKPQNLGWKAIYQPEKDEEEENINPVGQNASVFVFEGSNKKPVQPSIKWLKTQLEKYDVGSGATRTQTIGDISDGKKAVMVETKGKLKLNETGRISYLFLKDTYIGSPEATAILFGQMKEVAQLNRDPETILQNANEVMAHDIEQFKKNVALIPQGMDSFEKFEQKEKASFTSKKGKELVFNKTWGSGANTYLFSDEEIINLANGQEITITRSDGKSFTGSLKYQSYNGHKFLGFMPNFVKSYEQAKGV
ncbi:MAG: type IA DNA topoisomerase [Streptococcaceae bacterium]|jgi:DNA topoisomerase-3|nr:type IA DNA topoisomerase [Streptococcaceae bacterium]